MDKEEPWALKKTDVDRMNTVLYVLLETIRHISVLAQCIVPKAASLILDQLSIDPENQSFEKRSIESLHSPLQAGTAISKPEGVFPRIKTN